MTAPRPRSLARQVALRGAFIIAVTVVLVGVSTMSLFYSQQRDALDRMLVEAALSGAQASSEGEWRSEHQHATVETWLVVDGDTRIPSVFAEAAWADEAAVFMDLDDRRVALLVVESGRSDDDDDDVDDHDASHGGERGSRPSHRLVAAAAPALSARDAVGEISAIYALVGGLAALAAALLLWASVRSAFEPVERSRREAEHVVRIGQGARLTEAGPLEIRGLLVAVNALLDRLDAAFAVQGRFTAEAAHELRTPVAAMLGELDVALRRRRSEAEYRAVLESSREEVHRLTRIVSALTAFARVDTGHIEGAREPVRAAELARRALAAERTVLSGAGCAVDLQVDEDPEIVVHCALLELALGNLLRNAATHAAGAPVRLRVSHAGERAVFDVVDGGPGLAGEDRLRVFDRFVRGSTSRLSDRAGLGLGLPLAREIARRHGGDCIVEAAPGGGLLARLSVATG